MLRTLFAAAAIATAFAGSAFAQASPDPTTTSSVSPDDAVEVSLGQDDIRSRIAEELQVDLPSVPLTIPVSPELAAAVCPVSHQNLAEQKEVSPVRTCAAVHYSEALREVARAHLGER
ncbi:hypothetical protein NPA31_004705 [Aurantimonas sp. MSK8Z-1]|uniref:hypothetical protein n=1 Tax=Mangrovibrevibacter kandeliae TaxID=2968473 RepID=UPI0021192DE9|nr:hypothetical protein [Aurantimonas sp. MSK8Z-1]MCW4114263.1 hypothetical protein [Aurantimonas sp. MSK8Z-1]